MCSWSLWHFNCSLEVKCPYFWSFFVTIYTSSISHTLIDLQELQWEYWDFDRSVESVCRLKLKLSEIADREFFSFSLFFVTFFVIFLLFFLFYFFLFFFFNFFFIFLFFFCYFLFLFFLHSWLFIRKLKICRNLLC